MLSAHGGDQPFELRTLGRQNLESVLVALHEVTEGPRRVADFINDPRKL